MADWKIMICDSLASAGIERLRQFAQVDDLAGISPEDLAEQIHLYDALVLRGRTKMTAKLLDKADRLKLVARAGVGVDNIDLASARRHGVMVVNTPVATTTAVADHTLGLLLSLVRHIPRANEELKAGKWEKKSLIGLELAGKTFGIIGVGNIGQAVAQRAKGFDLNLIGHDQAFSATDFERLQIEPVTLSQLYTRADIISLHIPLTVKTQGMLNAAAFAQMKPGVLILSTARGGIIDEAELLRQLNSGQVGGAGLDVFENEPPQNLELLKHPNVVVTPHIAAQTREAQARAAVHAAEEIERKINGIPLRWQIV